MGKIYLTSDWHFNHNKTFCYEPRGFQNVEEMNNAIVENHNRIVTADDDVYCLGDCMLGDNEQAIKYILQLSGKLHIICGNHDTDTRRGLYVTCPNVVEVVDAKRLRYSNYHFFLCHYPCLSTTIDRPLKQGTISLCGHLHTADPFSDWDKGKIYHCEVDAHNCEPKLIDEIIAEMKLHNE